MTELDRYIYECVKNSKRPGGVKINRLKSQGFTRNFTDAEIYCRAKSIDTPLCPLCNEKPRALKSFKTGDFALYCSMECYSKELSKRNLVNNHTLNQRLAEENRHAQRKCIDKAIDEYVTSHTATIKELASRYKISRTYLTDELKKRKLLDVQRRAKVLRQALSVRLQTPNSFLEDPVWIKEKIDSNWTTKMVADFLGCSQDYVATKSREIGCPFPRSRTVSSLELMMREYLHDKGYVIETNNRTVLNGKEIDIVLPDFDIGIEMNGAYWHQHIDGQSDKNYHKAKTDLAKENGLSLIHIFDFELQEKLPIIKSIIEAKAGKNTRLYARKCEVRQLTSTEYREFLDANHIKGKISSAVRLGLFHDGSLVMCAGFSKPRFNRNHTYELIRLCSKSGFTVVGGASKLFKHFVSKHKPESVISYCDRRFFSGDVYSQIGMKFVSTSSPNYYWVKSGTASSGYDVLSRYQTQKHKICSPQTQHMTENEIMRGKNYMKIYDCGQDLWEWKR